MPRSGQRQDHRRHRDPSTSGGPVQEPGSLGDHDEIVDVPVLIVGGGPSGLLQAYLLSKLGVRSLVIEKYPERLAAPKAHALCPRTLEICRQFGLNTQALRKLGAPREDAYWVNFVTNLSGELIGALPYERMDPQVLGDTPEMIHNIPQPQFEQFIAAELHSDSNVELRKGVSFVCCDQSPELVITTVEERATQQRYCVRSLHVLACDGARSAVRKSLGVGSEGEDGYETMMTIHFRADLRPVLNGRVGMLHWITDPACSGFIIAYDIAGNHVLISNFDATRYPTASWNTKLCREIVTAAVGQDIPCDILSFRPWVLSRKVALKYHVGNVFLVGDAAHSFPPTGGLGLNSGLADAHNLAYKIAAVHQGWATKRILDSYVAERRQIALVNSAQSVKNGKRIFSFVKALGTANIEDVQEARRNLLRTINDPEKQEMISREVEGQREHFDNLAIHIGYVYGDISPQAHASHYVPKFVAGARLPHAWIRFGHNSRSPPNLAPLDVSYIREWGQSDLESRRWSTLDLCALNAFTLITGPRGKWQRHVEELQAWVRTRAKLRLEVHAVSDDFDFVYPDQRAMFEAHARLGEGGALLVRPDQHILQNIPPGGTAAEIAALLLDHLGFDSGALQSKQFNLS